MLVRLDGVEALILQLVGADLVGEPDAAPFLVQVEEHAAALGRDALHGPRQLGAAVATAGAEHVAGQALRVDAHEHAFPVAHVAPHERDVGPPVDDAVVGGHGEGPVRRRKPRRRQALHEPVVAHPVLDQIRHRDHQQAVPAREPVEVRHAGHRAVVVHDLADDAGRIQAGEPGQVHRRFGLACAHQHAAVARPQGRHVAGLGEVGRPGRRIDRHPDRRRAVGGRDAGRRDVLRVDRHGEGGLEPRRVLVHDHRDVELVEALPGHRQADQAPSVAGHEVDRVRRDLVGGDGQIAFVLAILVVDHDQHAAAAERLDRLVDGREARAGGGVAGGRRFRLPVAHDPVCVILAGGRRRPRRRGRRTFR